MTALYVEAVHGRMIVSRNGVRTAVVIDDYATVHEAFHAGELERGEERYMYALDASKRRINGGSSRYR